MKKYVAILALLVSGSVFADPTASVSYQVQQNDSGSQGHVMNYSLSDNLIKNLGGDVTINSFVNDSTNASILRTEVGLTPKYDVTDYLNVSSRFSLGEVQTSSKGNWQTYTVEPKATVKLPYSFDANVGFRFRTALQNDVLDTSRTYSTSIGYSVTQKDRISVGYSKLFGDNGNQANNGNKTYAVSYAHGF
jgi:hypothetical protein